MAPVTQRDSWVLGGLADALPRVEQLAWRARGAREVAVPLATPGCRKGHRTRPPIPQPQDRSSLGWNGPSGLCRPLCAMPPTSLGLRRALHHLSLWLEQGRDDRKPLALKQCLDQTNIEIPLELPAGECRRKPHTPQGRAVQGFGSVSSEARDWKQLLPTLSPSGHCLCPPCFLPPGPSLSHPEGWESRLPDRSQLQTLGH